MIWELQNSCNCVNYVIHISNCVRLSIIKEINFVWEDIFPANETMAKEYKLNYANLLILFPVKLFKIQFIFSVNRRS